MTTAAARRITKAMSLKAIHIAFITVAGLCSLVFGLWTLRDWRSTGETTSLVLGLLFMAVLVSLIPYGRWFLRKFKNESYL